jgi:tetratricopeptide (TPR) repeat protein
MMQRSHKELAALALNDEGIQLIRLGDPVKALISFHRALLILSSIHSPLNGGDGKEDEFVYSLGDIVHGSCKACTHLLLSESPSVVVVGRKHNVSLDCNGEQQGEHIQSHTPNKNKTDECHGINHDRRTDFDEGMCLFKQFVLIPTDEHVDEEVVHATLLYNIAILHSQMNEEEEAELHFSKVLSIITARRRSIFELCDNSCSNRPGFQGPTFLAVLHNIGHMQFQSKKYEDAVRTYRKVLRNTALFSASDEELSNNDKYFNIDVSSALNCLGVSLSYMAIEERTLVQREERLEKASNALTQALAIRNTVIGNGHDLETATILNNLGRVKFLMDSLHEAHGYYEEAYHIRTSFLGKTHIDIAAVLYNIGQVHHRFGNLQKALNHYHDSLDIISIEIGKGHPNVTHLLLEIGDVHVKKESFNLAIEFYTQALGSEWCHSSRKNDRGESQQQHSNMFSCIKKKLDECRKFKRRHNVLHKP